MALTTTSRPSSISFHISSKYSKPTNIANIPYAIPVTSLLNFGRVLFKVNVGFEIMVVVPLRLGENVIVLKQILLELQ